jgi:tRNA-modifying protein YgfZ
MTELLKAVVLRDRSVVAVSGTDRVKFLQGLITNDIHRLAPDRALYAGFLTGQGKLLHDVFLVHDGDRILIDIATALVRDFVKRLTGFRLRTVVEICETSLAVAGAWGSETVARLGLDSAEGLVRHGAPGEAHLAFVDPRMVTLGARLIEPAAAFIEGELAQLGFSAATAADYAEHRLALGVADTGEIVGQYPLEANFEMLHGVDFRKGCYVGQELTARMKFKSKPRKRILPVSGSSPLPAAGTPVTADGTELGPLIAASGNRGLALLRLDRLADATEKAIRAQDIELSIHWPDWMAQSAPEHHGAAPDTAKT